MNTLIAISRVWRNEFFMGPPESSLMACGDDSQSDGVTRRLRNVNGNALRLHAPEQFLIEVGIRLQGFPSKEAVVARRNAPEKEPSTRIACGGSVEIGSFAIAFRNENNLGAGRPAHLRIHGGAIDVACLRTQNNFNRAVSPCKVTKRLPEDVGLIEARF